MADLFGQFPFVLTSATAAVDECFPSGIQLGRGQVLIPAVNEALKQTIIIYWKNMAVQRIAYTRINGLAFKVSSVHIDCF